MNKQDKPLSDKAQILSFCKSHTQPLLRGKPSVTQTFVHKVCVQKKLFRLTHTIGFEYSSAANASASLLSKCHEATNPRRQDCLTSRVISL